MLKRKYFRERCGTGASGVLAMLYARCEMTTSIDFNGEQSVKSRIKRVSIARGPLLRTIWLSTDRRLVFDSVPEAVSPFDLEFRQGTLELDHSILGYASAGKVGVT